MFNPRDLEKLMKNVKMEEIEANEVLIRSASKTIAIKNPKVVKTEMMGQTTYQVTGNAVEENATNDADIDLVIQKTGVSRDEASKILQETGDMASAIMKIESQKNQ